MNFLLGPMLKYVALGLLVALAGVVVALRIQTGRLADRTQERNAATAEVARLLAATAGKDQTIDAMMAAAKAWKALSTPTESMMAAANRVEAAAQEIAARSRALTPAEVKDHADPDCAALLALDIARACPGIAAGMRTRAAQGGVRRSGGGGSGAGGEEGGQPPH